MVTGGVAATYIEQANEGVFKRQAGQSPFVKLNVTQSVPGYDISAQVRSIFTYLTH